MRQRMNEECSIAINRDKRLKEENNEKAIISNKFTNLKRVLPIVDNDWKWK